MTPVLLGLLVTMGVAVAIVLGVALPHLRQGSKILSGEGEERVRQLRRRMGPGGGSPVPTPPGYGQVPPGYGQVPPAGGRRRAAPVPPPASTASTAAARMANGTARSVTSALTRAREAFDGAASRAGRAAERVDVPGTSFGASAERIGEKVRRGTTGAIRWLGTKPERVPADPAAPVTATAPHGIPVLPDPAHPLPPEAPRTPEVGVPADPAAGGPDVIDLRDRPIGLTIDLRELPQMPPLSRPVPVRDPGVREDGAGATAGRGVDDLRHDLADELDDGSVDVGPRHAR